MACKFNILIYKLTLSHYLFHASFVPLIALHTDHGSRHRPEWVHDVSLTCEVLHTLRDDPLAKRCLSIVHLLSPSDSQVANICAPFDNNDLLAMLHSTDPPVISPSNDLVQTLCVSSQFSSTDWAVYLLPTWLLLARSGQ